MARAWTEEGFRMEIVAGPSPGHLLCTEPLAVSEHKRKNGNALGGTVLRTVRAILLVPWEKQKLPSAFRSLCLAVYPQTALQQAC